MGRKQKREKPNNLAVAAIFTTFVVSLLVVSFFIKLGILIKESSFDGAHRFTIAISSTKEQAASDKSVQIISFSPSDQSVNRMFLSEQIPLEYTQRFLEVPINATILISGDRIADDRELDSVLRKIVVEYKDAKTSLTFLDVLRLWWLGREISSHSITDEDFSPNPSLPKEIQADQVSQKLFADDDVAKEKQTVEIVNGADIAGFGTRLSRLITNMGGNVISVQTADSVNSVSSIVYFGNKSYTVSKLENILQIKAKQKKGSDISDIIVTLGKDKSNTVSF